MLGGRMTSNQIKRLTNDEIDKMPLTADVGLAMKSNIAVIAPLQSRIDIIERRLQERIKPRPQYGLLTSVPGIGQTLATVIFLETGSIERFAEVGNFASYARCVDRVHTPAIARRKAKATSRTATNISPGHSSRWRISRNASVPRSRGSTSARRRTRTRSSPPRRWRTSWRALVIIS
jgi:transposase